MEGFRSLLDPPAPSKLRISICPQELRCSDKERAVHTKRGLADSPFKMARSRHHLSRQMMSERVGFEPTVPLPRRMLSKHVDSSTLAPLHTDLMPGGEHLSTRSEHQQGNQAHKSTHVRRPDIDRTLTGEGSLPILPWSERR